MTASEYRVRVQRFGMPDQFHNKKTDGKAIQMLPEWEMDRTGRTRFTLDGSANLTIESRQVTEWGDVTDVSFEETILLGQGDGP